MTVESLSWSRRRPRACPRTVPETSPGTPLLGSNLAKSSFRNPSLVTVTLGSVSNGRAAAVASTKAPSTRASPFRCTVPRSMLRLNLPPLTVCEPYERPATSTLARPSASLGEVPRLSRVNAASSELALESPSRAARSTPLIDPRSSRSSSSRSSFAVPATVTVPPVAPTTALIRAAPAFSRRSTEPESSSSA